MITTAEFSPCRTYRYSLTRIWDETKPLAVFCMLNPSTADEIQNDPTIERCQRRANDMNYGGLIVVNIFAYRSTDPKALFRVADPIGPENDSKLIEIAKKSGMFICGWGNHGTLKSRGNAVLQLLKSSGILPFALK